jgi:carboxymethylenebutenolidase
MTETPRTGEDRRLGHLRLHVAEPSEPAHVAMLLYPTIFGLDDTMRTFARALALAGITAVVWDPYDGEDAAGGVPGMVERSKTREDETMVADLRTVVDHVVGDLGIAAVAGLGWCFGGRIAVLHAGHDDRVQAVCAYNPTIWPEALPADVAPTTPPLVRSDFPGQTMDEFDLAARIAGPVQVCHPEHDFTPQAEYDRLLAALYGRPTPTTYEYYPGCDHGFSYTPGPANALAHRMAWAGSLALLSATFDTVAP